MFDDQVHFLREDADPRAFEPLTGMIALTADILSLPQMAHDPIGRIRFAGFLKDLYLDSDTHVALLCGAPGDEADGWMLTNDMMALARERVNQALGGRRLLTHAVLAPGQPGWLDEIDRAHADLKPDGWNSYTVGAPSILRDFAGGSMKRR